MRTHGFYDPASGCPGVAHISRQASSGGRVMDVWECRRCGVTNDPAVEWRLWAIFRKLRDSGRLDPPPPTAEERRRARAAAIEATWLAYRRELVQRCAQFRR